MVHEMGIGKPPEHCKSASRSPTGSSSWPGEGDRADDGPRRGRQKIDDITTTWEKWSYTDKPITTARGQWSLEV